MQMPALMTLAARAAQHAAARQSVAARNLANADTPGYAAADLAPFDARREARAMRAGAAPAWRAVATAAPRDPNGNAVDLEDEILRATDAQRAHDRALTVYRASLDLLRAGLGRGR